MLRGKVGGRVILRDSFESDVDDCFATLAVFARGYGIWPEW
jgi:hypothetical protein